MGVDLDTGQVTDYSPTSQYYEEAEGINPKGKWVLVERDLAVVIFPGELDIWRLALDGSGEFERLTTFNHYEDHGATNPVVSPDGTAFAFQLEKAGSEHGEGHGLLLFDLAAYYGMATEDGSEPSRHDDSGQESSSAPQGDDTSLPTTGSSPPLVALALLALASAARSRSAAASGALRPRAVRSEDVT